MAFDIRHIEQSPTAFAFAYRQDPLKAVQDLAALAGDGVVVPDLRNRQLMFANHPDLFCEVLIKQVDAFVKARGLQLARHLLGNGLLTSEEPHHGRMRKLVLPAFHHSRLRLYGDVMARLAEEAAGRWTDGATFDLHHDMMTLTLAVAVETLFGAEVEEEVKPIRRATADAFLFYDVRNPVALHGTDAIQGVRDTFDKVIYRFIARRRQNPADTGDLLSMLLAAQEEGTGVGLTDEEVRDEAVNLLIAGHETNAVALTCTLWAMAGHPEVQERLHAEVDAVLGGRRATFDDLHRLSYTRQVLSEGMRLYPPVWVLGRQATRPVEIGGVTLAPDSTVVLSMLTLHRDPRWWEEPEAFRPERFAAKQPKFTYLPFGVGQRGCIGESFAWVEGVLVLASLVQRWRFHRVTEDMKLFAGLTLRPHGDVLMRVERRDGTAVTAPSAAVRAEAA